MGSARICTVHSFLSQLVRRHFHQLGLPANVRVAEESETEWLRTRLMGETVELLYEENDAATLNAAENFSGPKNDRRFEQTLLDLHAAIFSLPDPQRLLEENLRALEENSFASGGWEQVWLDALADGLESRTAALEGALAEMTDGGFDGAADMAAVYASTFEAEAEEAHRLCRALRRRDLPAARQRLAVLLERKLPTLRKYQGDGEAKKRIKDARDKHKDCLKALQAKLDDLPHAEEELRRTARVLEPIIRLLLRFERRFEEEKKRLGTVSFNDLEHYALQLLVDPNGQPTPLALEIRQELDAVFVDEYQDTSPCQDLLFEALAQKDNLFVVGDMKQSIYRFRGAAPQLFLRRRRAALPYGEGWPAYLCLNANFRSRPQILQLANDLFGRLFSPQLGDLAYTSEEAFVPGRACDDLPCCELLLTDGQGSFEDDGEEADLKAVEREAEAVARRLAALLKAGVPIELKDGTRRPVRAGDVAVLLRSIKNRGAVFVQALERHGIPAVSETGNVPFDSFELLCVLAVLQAIDNPLEDIPLAAAMKSPVFGFTDERLAQLRALCREGRFYRAVKAGAQRGEEDCLAFLQELELWRHRAQSQSVYCLLWQLYTQTPLMTLCGTDAAAPKRRANLLHLYRLARRFEGTGYKGLYSFLHYVSRLSQGKGELPASGAATAEGAVRIMSIHHSKGLEFPVTVVAGLATLFNEQDLRAPFLFHPELGLALRLQKEDGFTSAPTLLYEALAARTRRESLSEELRVLYVGVTRARDYLILSGCPKDLSQACASAAQTAARGCAPALLTARRCLLDWVLSALIRHPQCGVLRRLAKAEGDTEDYALPRLRVCLGHKLSDLSLAPQAPKGAPLTQGEEADDALIHQRLTFTYPYQALTAVPAKVSVTELRPALMEDEGFSLVRDRRTSLRPRPAFLEHGQATGSERGTAAHSFMQFCDFTRVEQQGLAEEAARLQERGFLTARQVSLLNLPKLGDFFRTPLYRRLRQAKKLFRELRFHRTEPASLLGVQGQDEVLVQGVCDLIFVEEDGAVLVDFKTDATRDAQALKEKYRTQLTLYARAAEALLGCPVKESYLYSFTCGPILL